MVRVNGTSFPRASGARCRRPAMCSRFNHLFITHGADVHRPPPRLQGPCARSDERDADLESRKDRWQSAPDDDCGILDHRVTLERDIVCGRADVRGAARAPGAPCTSLNFARSYRRGTAAGVSLVAAFLLGFVSVPGLFGANGGVVSPPPAAA